MAKATAGYSNTPLLKKSGIKDDVNMLVLNFPGGHHAYWKLIGRDCTAQLCNAKQVPSFIHLFAKDEKEFLQTFYLLEKRLHGSVMFWVIPLIILI